MRPGECLTRCPSDSGKIENTEPFVSCRHLTESDFVGPFPFKEAIRKCL
jgi:hypothetical protein